MRSLVEQGRSYNRELGDCPCNLVIFANFHQQLVSNNNQVLHIPSDSKVLLQDIHGNSGRSMHRFLKATMAHLYSSITLHNLL